MTPTMTQSGAPGMPSQAVSVSMCMASAISRNEWRT